MKNEKQLLITNTTINTLGHIYLVIASIISTPIILNNIGIQNFSILALITTILSLSSMLNLGTNQATIKYISQTTNKSEQKKYAQSSSLITTILLAIIVTLSNKLITITTNKLNIPTNTINLTTILLAINFITNYLNTIPQALNNFYIYNIKTIVVGSTTTLITAMIAITHPTNPIQNILTARIISQLITAIILTLYAKAKIATPVPQYHKQHTAELISFSAKKALGMIFSQLNFHTPRIAIIKYTHTANLAIFTIPQSIISNIQAIISQLTKAIFPISSRIINTTHKTKLRQLITTTQKIILASAMSLNILILLFGKSILTLWLRNTELANSIYPILQILTLTYSISMLSAIPATILESIGKPEIPTKYIIINFILQIASLYMLIPRFGFIGVPIAMLIHTSIQVPLFLMAFKKEMDKIA